MILADGDCARLPERSYHRSTHYPISDDTKTSTVSYERIPWLFTDIP